MKKRLYKSFIPKGSLHKNRHYLEDRVLSKYGVRISKKGIPVISDNGQIAEIETGEIVMNNSDKTTLDKAIISVLKKDKDFLDLGKMTYKILDSTIDETNEYKTD